MYICTIHIVYVGYVCASANNWEHTPIVDRGAARSPKNARLRPMVIRWDQRDSAMIPTVAYSRNRTTKRVWLSLVCLVLGTIKKRSLCDCIILSFCCIRFIVVDVIWTKNQSNNSEAIKIFGIMRSTECVTFYHFTITKNVFKSLHHFCIIRAYSLNLNIPTRPKTIKPHNHHTSSSRLDKHRNSRISRVRVSHKTLRTAVRCNSVWAQ